MRPETDALYERVILVLQWNYVYGTAPVDPKVIAEVVEKMNRQTELIETSYRQSQSQKRAAADKQPKDPKTPKDPKQPKHPADPKQPDQPKDPKKPETPQPPQPPKAGDDGDPDIHLPEE